MMCQRIGLPPTFTSGLGITSVSGASLVPRPPHRITTSGGRCWVEFITIAFTTVCVPLRIALSAQSRRPAQLGLRGLARQQLAIDLLDLGHHMLGAKLFRAAA